MARVAISPAHRTMLEHMAETWIRIAQDVQSDHEATGNGGGRGTSQKRIVQGRTVMASNLAGQGKRLPSVRM